VSFWRKEVIDHALDVETRLQMDQQLAWIAREPANARPYYHLAQLYRVAFKQDEALGLLLEAVRLDPDFAQAHAALTEIYVVSEDYPAAWRHARLAEQGGEARGVELLRRYGVSDQTR
jgi:cytochrome c-type biogenesis protein CcmH/NrfG